MKYEYKNQAICPCCGHEHEDSIEFCSTFESWEFECEEVECHSCGEIFILSRYVTVTYTSEEKEES